MISQQATDEHIPLKRLSVIDCVLLCGVVFASAFAQANHMTNAQARVFCKPYAAFARYAMQERQADTSLSTLMDEAGDTSNLSSIVLSAFEVPIFDEPKEREKAVNRFENEQYLNCYKAVSSDELLQLHEFKLP